MPNCIARAIAQVAMTTDAQWERTLMRIKLYVGHMVVTNGRGGQPIAEYDERKPGWVQMWLKYIQKYIQSKGYLY